MRLSRQSDYAIRLVLDLAQQPGHSGDIKGVAARRGAPAPYLAKIAQALARAGLVVATRGARGGIRLARPPARITLHDVVEAVEGPIVYNRCLLWPGECDPARPCPLHPVFQGLARTVSDYLVTPVDVLFYVVKGQGTVLIGDESASVGETDLVVSPKEIPHALRADRGEVFQVLVIKTPNPAHLAH
ncbi:MAG: Rrf2 family transcriptional regulator [Bacillota bacterium]